MVFFLLVFGALLVLRLPQIKWNAEVNPDESQMLAQAMRLLSHPVPWRDMDSTTSGPLNTMWLSLPMYFGASDVEIWKPKAVATPPPAAP